MAVQCDLNVDDAIPAHGQAITFTYVVTGNDPIAAEQVAISGVVTVGGVDQIVSTTITLPATPAASVSYQAPSGGGLTFVSTSDPAVFTAVVP